MIHGGSSTEETLDPADSTSINKDIVEVFSVICVVTAGSDKKGLDTWLHC